MRCREASHHLFRGEPINAQSTKQERIGPHHNIGMFEKGRKIAEDEGVQNFV